MTELDYSSLDQGIRETVRWLRLQGFMTYKSGNGKTSDTEHPEKAIGVPFVFIVALPEEVFTEAHRLWNLLRVLGLTRPIIELEGMRHACRVEIGVTWTAQDDAAIITLTHLDDELLSEAVANSRR
jgi:hypothetical protein